MTRPSMRSSIARASPACSSAGRPVASRSGPCTRAQTRWSIGSTSERVGDDPVGAGRDLAQQVGVARRVIVGRGGR